MTSVRDTALKRGVYKMGGIYEACASLLRHIPSDCGLCGERARGGALCPPCQGSVTHSMRHGGARCGRCGLALGGLAVCPDCSLRPPAFERVIAAFDYAYPGDVLIHHLKAGRRYASAGMLAGLLHAAVRAAEPPLPDDTLLLPVPSSRAAVLQRGFNPAAEVARALARRLQLEYRPGLVLRRREGRRQAHLSRADRLRSVHALYHCPQPLQGAKVAVVDDVLTTGSTLHGMAAALKEAGAATVTGLVLARTPYSAHR